MIVKNVTYLFALAAGLLTVSGCCGWFCGDKKNDQAVAAESKPLAENEAATEAAEAVTPVASAEGAVEQVATEETKVATETVAAAEAPASAMPMNEVAAAAPAEEKAA